MRRPAGRRLGTLRPAKTLVLFVLLLPALLAWCGLTIDAGLLMAGHRQAQNAADAAAVAAAKSLAAGNSASAALATANTYVQQYNGLPNAPALVAGTTFNVPPQSGPYAGNSSFVEVIVQSPVSTYFVGAAGFGPSPQVKTRAVAGFKAVTLDFGVAVLDPNAIPGLSLSGQSKLSVNGKIVVNSHGAGYDQNHQYINLGYPAYAVSVNGQSTITATDLEVVGGVDDPSSIVNAAGGGTSALHAGAQPLTDPLLNLPTPTTANGVVATYWGVNNGVVGSYASPQDVNLSGQVSVTLSPGIYKSISISGQVKLTLKSGVYVIAGGGFTVSGQCTVTGSGVMIYNTGSDYNATTGYPDAADGNQTPAPPKTTSFGGVNFNGQGSITLTPLSDTSSPFSGVLYYQRRWNASQFTITGQSSLSNSLGGTFYAKWANFNLSGQSNYNAQFVVGSMTLTGQSKITITYAGQQTGKAGNVYLVE